MQHDEMIWQVINHQFCTFKTTMSKALSDKTHFCRHKYSVTGLCNRTSCPLASSKYAVVREEAGRIHLYMKTVERAHSPKNQWERIVLSRNYSRALAQLDEHLEFFPKALMHRNKQRLTKIHQYLIRMRKIELKVRSGRTARVVGVHRKIDQREERRERKALVAAKIEKEVEKELVERLARGTYGDIYNFPEVAYNKALDDAEEQEEADEELESESEEEEGGVVEYVEDLDSEEEEEEELEDMEYMGGGQWGKQDDDDDDDDSENDDREVDDASSKDEDDEADDDERSNEKKKKPPLTKEKRTDPRNRRGARVEIEYEEEREDQQLQAHTAAETTW
jgi:protein MAK16